MRPTWTPVQQTQLFRTVRRSAPWFAATVVFILLSIPAFFDLESLFLGLAALSALLGVATAAFTWFDRRTAV